MHPFRLIFRIAVLLAIVFALLIAFLVANINQPAKAATWKFSAPAATATRCVTNHGYALRWNAVKGPGGQIPSSYTISTRQLNGVLVDQFTVNKTSALEYGKGGKGLHPGWSYITKVWANGGPLAPPNSTVRANLAIRLQSTSALRGGFDYGDYEVRQEMWGVNEDNPPSNVHQTLYAYSIHNWWVMANFPKGNKAVLTYPDSLRVFYNENSVDPKLGTFKGIKSTYDISMPTTTGVDAEYAYDIWLNSWNREIMIWTFNHGQTPAGHPVAKVKIAGQYWTVWQDQNDDDSTNVNGPVSFVLDHNASVGSVNIKAMLSYLTTNGTKYNLKNPGLTAIEFGPELCSTNGQLKRFAVNDYTLAVTR